MSAIRLDVVLAPGDARDLLRAAATRALTGGELRLVALAPGRPAASGGRTITVGEPIGARARSAAAWPDLLVDWSEIYEAPPYPGDAAPPLAEALSALGVPAFAVAFDPARDAAAVAEYERGRLVSLEHVGSSVVAWRDGEAGLSRPRMGGVGGGIASAARSLGADEGLLDRIESQHAAGARAIVERVLVRLLGESAPVDELAGRIALAASERLPL